MTLTYLFHSGFLLEDASCAVVFDYYQDSKDETEGILHDFLRTCHKPVYVLASHHHSDHYNPMVLSWKTLYPQVSFRYLFSNDIRSRLKVPRAEAVFLHLGEEFRDEYLSVKAYGSTDVGISFHVRLSGKDIFHAGDLNNWHWQEESTPQEIKRSQEAYDRELNRIARDLHHFDLVFFPVDPRLGRDYDQGAVQFVTRFPSAVFCPMHFWENYRVSDTLEKHFPAGCRVVHLSHRGQSVTL